MRDDPRLLRALLRERLGSFAQKTFATLEPGVEYRHSWHLDHLAWQLTRVARGEVRRLIINVPPRSMKSITVSIAFTAWLLGHDPRRRIICVSYAEELARKLSLDTRRVLETAWFRALFPACQLVPRRQRDGELTTTQQGGRLALGLGGALTGRGADVIVIDDPMKAQSAVSAAERQRVIDVYEGTLVSRLNDKQRGAIVLVMQRLHEDDLCGHLLERAGEDWEVVSLPAIASEDSEYRLSDRPGHVHLRRCGEVLQPEREPLDVLEGLRRQLGSMTFNAQYQQAPVPAGGNVIRREWLRSYDDVPERFDLVVAAWDTASTLSERSDWSVGLVWGAVGLDHYLLDVHRLRCELPELRRAIVGLSQRWSVDATLIEKTHLGHALLQDLRRTRELRAILVEPRYDKEARLLAQSARFEAGQVHLPVQAPWLGDYVSELLAFPNGRHDDQVDATSYALHYLTDRTSRLQPPARRSRASMQPDMERRRRRNEAEDAHTAQVANDPDELAEVPKPRRHHHVAARQSLYRLP